MCTLVMNLQIVDSRSWSCHTWAFWSLRDGDFFFANNPYMLCSSNYLVFSALIIFYGLEKFWLVFICFSNLILSHDSSSPIPRLHLLATARSSWHCSLSGMPTQGPEPIHGPISWPALHPRPPQIVGCGTPHDDMREWAPPAAPTRRP
jgi:hypothetical protein